MEHMPRLAPPSPNLRKYIMPTAPRPRVFEMAEERLDGHFLPLCPPSFHAQLILTLVALAYRNG